jgi:putative FmdB family regulatory protein
MPIYEYDCPTCGRFDVLQKMSAAPLETHDACGAKVTKLMSAGSFSIKGGGAQRAGDRPPCAQRSDAPACASCPSALG